MTESVLESATSPFDALFAPTEAQLVYDQHTLIVPKQLGKPRKDQLQGTDGEKLVEIAGRTCYDSFGSGRSSKDYHGHIAEVGHRSVWEHYSFTVNMTVNYNPATVLTWLLNRPGLFVNVSGVSANDCYRLTMNLRTLMEWRRWSYATGAADMLGLGLQHALKSQVPQIIELDDPAPPLGICGQLMKPVTPDEQHVSLWVKSSRGWSHEMVRHRLNGISQRSTRYVDESESAWVLHPHLRDLLMDGPSYECLRADIAYTVGRSKSLYDAIVTTLQDSLLAAGVDKLTARKQARGAARGFLGNALATQMIFTASVRQWWCLLAQRLHPAADAEMQEAAGMMLRELRRSQYAASFTDANIVAERERIAEKRPYNGRK